MIQVMSLNDQEKQLRESTAVLSANETADKVSKITNRNERIWSKDLLLVMLISFFSGTAVTTQMGTLPLYVAYLGGSEGVSGAVVGILGIAALFSRVPIGYLLDRFGRKTILIAGLSILVLDFLFLNLYKHLIILFFLRMLQGVGFGTQTTAVSTLASDLIPKSKLSIGLGYFSIAQTLPSAIGPLIGLYLVEHYGFDQLFLVGFVMVSIALTLSLAVSDRYKKALLDTKSKIKTRQEKSSMLILKKEVVIPSLVLFIVCLTNAGITAFLSKYAIEKEIAHIGLFFTVNALSTVLIRLVFPKLLTTIRTEALVTGSLVLIIASFLLIAFSQTLFQLLVAAALFGMGFASLLPIMNTIVLESVDDHQRGSATATFSGALDVAYGGGAMLWGFVAMQTGFSVMYQICAAFVAVNFFIIAKYRRKLF